MTVRARYRVEASVSSTTAEEKDLGNLKMEQVSDGSAEGGTRKNVIAAGAVDVNVTPSQVALATLLVVRTSAVSPNDTPGTIQLKKNSTGGEAWSIIPMPGAKEGHFVTTTGSVSAIFVSNPGTVAMEVTVMAAGD